MLIPKSERIRDKAYTNSAKNRHCLVRHSQTGDFCNGHGVVCCHIRTPENSGTNLKPGDDETLWLCFDHHNEFDGRHRGGDIGAALWLIRNVYIPNRKAAYRKWKSETGS